MLCNLQQGNAQAPHVARNGVTLARYSFGCHVVTRANKRVGVALCAKLAGYTEVAQLDLTVATEKDVGWFDIAVDDAVLVQVGQAVEDAFCDLTQHLFARAAAELLHFTVDGIEGTAFAELHGDADGAGRVVKKGAKVSAYEVGLTVFVEGKLTYDLFPDSRVRVCRDNLLL